MVDRLLLALSVLLLFVVRTLVQFRHAVHSVS